MSKTARAKMLDRINKRAKRFRDAKEKANKTITHTRIIYNFLQDVEKIYIIASDPIEFKVMLDQLCKNLDSNMKSLDTQVHMELVAEGGDPDWRTLRITGVKIKWSNGYIARNPETTQDEHIDVTQFLLQDPDTI